MLHHDQVEQARKLLAYLETRSTATADGVYRNEISDYTCPKQLAREREVFFKRGPFTVGLSCLLPKAGDFVSDDYAAEGGRDDTSEFMIAENFGEGPGQGFGVLRELQH